MTFQKGNQLQRVRGPQARARFLTQQLIAELNEFDPSEGIQKFRVLVRRLVERAIRPENADFAAMQFIFDRVEGRAMQAIEMSGPERKPIEQITMEMPLSDIARLYAQTLGSSEDGVDPEVEDDPTNVVPLRPAEEDPGGDDE